MNRLILRFITASALFFGSLLPSAEVTAQTTKKDLVGSWTLVSITLERDGKKTDFYGPDPQGQATYEVNGRLSVIITRSDLPPFASKNRELGTPEENKAIVQGSIAFFGTYSIDEATHVLTINVEGSTFPNFTGGTQTRILSFSDDEVTYFNPTPSMGGSAKVTYRRAK